MKLSNQRLYCKKNEGLKPDIQERQQSKLLTHLLLEFRQQKNFISSKSSIRYIESVCKKQ